MHVTPYADSVTYLACAWTGPPSCSQGAGGGRKTPREGRAWNNQDGVLH